MHQPDSNDSLVGTLFAGRFHIEGRIGTGGMGSVYRARHAVLQRTVALKLVRKELLADLTVAGRFRREARAASRIDHPHVIRIEDFGQSEDGRLYLVMEYVEGPTLGEVLDEHGAFPVGRAMVLLHQIASALRAAHACNVIHRDLKPTNTLVTVGADGQDHVKILDFGLAKILDLDATGGLSAHGRVFGTPEYMSPERCMDKPCDHRSDLYSLGVIAYELLVGEVPFRGKVVQILAGHISSPPPAPSQAASRSDIPQDLDALVLRCLAKLPEDRVQSAEEVLEALAALRGRVPAWRPSATGPLPGRTDAIEGPLSGHDTIIYPQQPDYGGGADRFEALEELAYLLRDEGLGTPDLVHQLALLLEARDHQLEAGAARRSYERQSEELLLTAQNRENRLSQVLSQLAHELAAAGPDGGIVRRLEVRAHAVSQRIQALAANLQEQQADTQARIDEVDRSLDYLQQTVLAHAEALADSIRVLLPSLEPRVVEELGPVLRRAGF